MNLKEAAKHFHVSPQSMLSFTRRNINKINRNGEIHAIEIQGNWAFDGAAIKIIEELKGLNVDTAEEISAANANKDLRLVADDLQVQLTTALAEMTQTAKPNLPPCANEQKPKPLKLPSWKHRNRN